MTQHPDLPYEQAKNSEYLARLKAKRPTDGRREHRAEPEMGRPDERSSCPSDSPITRLLDGSASTPRMSSSAEPATSGQPAWTTATSRSSAGTHRSPSCSSEPGDEGFTVDGELAVRRTFDHRVRRHRRRRRRVAQRVDPSPFDAGDLQVPAPSTPRADRRARRVLSRTASRVPPLTPLSPQARQTLSRLRRG